ncbi:MAG: carboxypeptidase regulatory-like domain-containing protein [Pyrinomonadaceae bacterium]|nr:carboxypeptidase regulatory-like domain-containing protein [Pyrinomonadaceae bacterium]
MKTQIEESCVLSLVLIAFCSFGHVTARANVRDSTRPPLMAGSSAVNPTVVNLRNFGAVGDGAADDGPALQQSLNALSAAGGGTLFVPEGRYAINTPVMKDFSNLSASVIIRGVDPSPDPIGPHIADGLGSLSEFVIKVGASSNALTVAGLRQLLIEDLTFIGDPAVEDDAHTVLAIHEIADARLRNCEFYGLASFVDGGSIVYAYHSGLKVEGSAFLGCAASSGLRTSVIQNVWWREVSITDTRFIDYGWRPDFFSKTTLSPPYSWISVGNAAAVDDPAEQRQVIIRNVFLDEGVFVGLSCIPAFFTQPQAGAPIDLIFISGLQVNVTNLGGNGVYLSDARRVFIERSHFGWSHVTTAAIALGNIGDATIDRADCVDAANIIYADDATHRLTVINSVYATLDSSAQITKVVTTAPADDPVQYVREQYLSVLGQEPKPAELIYWADQFLGCDASAQCTAEKRLALSAYLGATPAPTYTLSGRILNSRGDGLPSVFVALSGTRAATVMTDSTGNYAFPDLPTAGHYVVTPEKTHYDFAPPFQVVTNPGQDRVVNFGATLKRHLISGTVTDGVKPLSGVTVSLSGTQSAVVTTGGDGAYSFVVDAGGAYTIAVAKDHYMFDQASRNFSDLSGDQVFDSIGVLRTYTISGMVTAAKHAPLGGASVELSGAQSLCATTADDGTYSFTVAAGGNYTVTPSKPGYAFGPASRTFSSLGGNQVTAFTGALLPVLLTEDGTARTVALDSTTMVPGPFSLTSSRNFAADGRTRLMLFALYVDAESAENISVINVQAEDAAQRIYPLAVEYAGSVAGFEWLTQIIVTLPDQARSADQLWISVSQRGAVSNKGLIAIQRSENSFQ